MDTLPWKNDFKVKLMVHSYEQNSALCYTRGLKLKDSKRPLSSEREGEAQQAKSEIGVGCWLVGWVLWHNLCRVFKAKSNF